MSIFRPASFRRFLTDITHGPDDLMAIAEATREPLTDQHAEYAAAHAARDLTDEALAAAVAEWRRQA